MPREKRLFIFGVFYQNKGQGQQDIFRKVLKQIKFGRLNIIIGGGAISLAGLGGFFFGFTMDFYFKKGFYGIPSGRTLLKAGPPMACQ